MMKYSSSHGRTGIEHVFFGSVAEKVIRHSPFPVIMIPCKRKPEFPTIYLYRGREREFVKIQPKR
ncbi:MAG: universal stress protein [Deltaproteobacteria bacterium]|nr:MAG: universal stress protein [Deltaproteobacteria bacterium]